jgi:hypothetical protein
LTAVARESPLNGLESDDGLARVAHRVSSTIAALGWLAILSMSSTLIRSSPHMCRSAGDDRECELDFYHLGSRAWTACAPIASRYGFSGAHADCGAGAEDDQPASHGHWSGLVLDQHGVLERPSEILASLERSLAMDTISARGDTRSA